MKIMKLMTPDEKIMFEAQSPEESFELGRMIGHLMKADIDYEMKNSDKDTPRLTIPQQNLWTFINHLFHLIYIKDVNNMPGGKS